MARPTHEPTKELQDQVKAMAAFGIRHDDIARVIGISKVTLLKHYRKILDTAEIGAVTKVAASLYQQAIGGNTTAQIFYLKTRGRWRETGGDTTEPPHVKVTYKRASDD